MRLIDADELVESLNELYDYFLATKRINRSTGIADAIGDVVEKPTIKAIPINWIKQWSEKHEHTNAYSIVDVRNMINEWRQENESNISD